MSQGQFARRKNWLGGDMDPKAVDEELRNLRLLLKNLDQGITSWSNLNLSGPILLPDGTVSAPSLAFKSDQTTGMYLIGASEIGIALGGVNIEDISAAGIDWKFGGTTVFKLRNNQVLGVNGTNSNPMYSFSAENNTGMYRPGTNELAFSVGGDIAADFQQSSISLKTNTVSALSVDTSQNVSVGNTKLQVAGNQILPVVQIKTNSTATVGTTTSTSYVNSNLAVTITPKFSTSTIYIIATGQMNSSVSSGYVTISRGAANLLGASGGAACVSGNSLPFTLQMYDQPGAGATTYNVQFKVDAGGTIAMPTNTFATAPTAWITAMEFAG